MNKYLWKMGPMALASACALAENVPLQGWDFAKAIDFDCVGVRQESGFRVSNRAGERRDSVTVWFPWLGSDLPLVFRGERKEALLVAKLDQRRTFKVARELGLLPADADLLGEKEFRALLLERYVKQRQGDVRYGKEVRTDGVSYREAFILADSIRFGAGLRFPQYKKLKGAKPNALIELVGGPQVARSLELRCSKPALLDVAAQKQWVASTVALFEAVDAGDLDAAKEAILKGADLSVVDPETGDSVLHFATGHPAMLKLLVEQEFLPKERRQELDMNAVNNNGETLLWHAVTAYRKESVAYLKKAGALPVAFYEGKVFNVRDAILVTLGRPNKVGEGLSEAQARVARRSLDRMWGAGSSMLELEEMLAIIDAK